jgi:hypothetical protein
LGSAFFVIVATEQKISFRKIKTNIEYLLQFMIILRPLDTKFDAKFDFCLEYCISIAVN